jgi:hypothetical protein
MPTVNTLRIPACPTSISALALAWVVIACGPPQAGDTGDGSSTATASTSSGSDTSGEEDPGSETGPDPSTSTTASFVPEDDQRFEPCDTFAQDCPEGEKCVPYSSDGGVWDSNKCVPVMGDQGPGEPCVYGGIVDATDDCGADSICWDVVEVDGEWIGQCLLQCTGSSDQPSCPAGSACLLSGSGVISICVVSCDPLLQDCGEGLACSWTYDNFACLGTNGVEPGQPCHFINDCAVGLACTDGDGVPDCANAACCTPYCSLAGDQACAAVPGTSCVPFFEEGMAPLGYDEVGVCLLA